MRVFSAILSSLLMVGVTAQASLSLNPSVIFLRDGKMTSSLSIFSKNDYRSYLELQAFPGECVDNICKQQTDAAPVQDQLLFSRPKFILDPGQKTQSIISWAGKLPNKLMYFEVVMKDHAQDATKITKSSVGKTNFILNLVVQYKTRVYVLPEQAIAGFKNPRAEVNNAEFSVENHASTELMTVFLYKCKSNACQLLSKQKPTYLESAQTYTMKMTPEDSVTVRYFDPTASKWFDLIKDNTVVT